MKNRTCSTIKREYYSQKKKSHHRRHHQQPSAISSSRQCRQQNLCFSFLFFENKNDVSSRTTPATTASQWYWSTSARQSNHKQYLYIPSAWNNAQTNLLYVYYCICCNRQHFLPTKIYSYQLQTTIIIVIDHHFFFNRFIIVFSYKNPSDTNNIPILIMGLLIKARGSSPKVIWKARLETKTMTSSSSSPC